MVTTRSPLDGALTNDQWVTQEDIPDPTPLPRIPGVGILVRPVPIRRKTAGGILLPDTFREDREYLNTVGRVLALGELSFMDEDIYRKGPWVKPGDFIELDLLPMIQAKVDGVPVFECDYGTLGQRYGVRIREFLTQPVAAAAAQD